MEGALLIGIFFIIQQCSLCSPRGTGRDWLRWHIHHQLYVGGPPCSSSWCGLGSSFPRLQRLLLLCEHCCLLYIKRGYSQGHRRLSGEWFPWLCAPSCGSLSGPVGCQACTPHHTQPRWDAQGHLHHSGSPLSRQPQECYTPSFGCHTALCSGAEWHYHEDFVGNYMLSICIIYFHSFVHIKQFIEHVQ